MTDKPLKVEETKLTRAMNSAAALQDKKIAAEMRKSAGYGDIETSQPWPTYFPEYEKYRFNRSIFGYTGNYELDCVVSMLGLKE